MLHCPTLWFLLECQHSSDFQINLWIGAQTAGHEEVSFALSWHQWLVTANPWLPRVPFLIKGTADNAHSGQYLSWSPLLWRSSTMFLKVFPDSQCLNHLLSLLSGMVLDWLWCIRSVFYYKIISDKLKRPPLPITNIKLSESSGSHTLLWMSAKLTRFLFVCGKNEVTRIR